MKKKKHMKIEQSFPYSLIMSELPTGEQMAISAGELSKRVGVPDKRSLRLLIEQLRHSSICICSSDKGYWLPGNKKEANAWKNHMLGLSKKYKELADSANEYLKS